MDSELAVTLADMAAEDRRIRNQAMAQSNAFVLQLDSATASELRRVDARNASRLQVILSRHGWPGRSLVADQGFHDAWLIVQHTDLQRRA